MPGGLKGTDPLTLPLGMALSYQSSQFRGADRTPAGNNEGLGDWFGSFQRADVSGQDLEQWSLWGPDIFFRVSGAKIIFITVLRPYLPFFALSFFHI